MTSVSFSADGKCIVSGSADKTIRIWDVDTGELVVGPLEGHTYSVRSVGFSPDGKYVVSGSDDKTIRIWNAKTGESICEPIYGHTHVVRSVSFSPDGEKVVSGSNDGTVRVWYVATAEPIGEPFRGHTDWVTSVGVSPDGNRIVSGSDDGTIRIWSVHTGETIAGPLYGHSGFIMSVAFSPDGKQVVSGSNDKTVRIWNVDALWPQIDEKHHEISLGYDERSIMMLNNQAIENTPSSPSIGMHNQDFGRSLASHSFIKAFIGFRHSRRSRMGGWILTDNRDLLLWVPEQYTPYVRTPAQEIFSIMGKQHILLDLQRFSHGTSWSKCFCG